MNSGGGGANWVPEQIDISEPSSARVYDYYLGGSHNFEVDREVARDLIAAMPTIADAAIANREFLRRAVRYMCDQGIDQFLDIGAGIPSVGNTHDVARRLYPRARVVYAEVDPAAVMLSKSLLEHDPLIDTIEADLRNPTELLSKVAASHVLDLNRPTGLMLINVVHFLRDSDDPAGVIASLTEMLAPGSHVALTHATRDDLPEEAVRVTGVYEKTPYPMTPRPKERIAAMVAPLSLVEPGIVHVPRWRATPTDTFADQPESAGCYGVVGRKE